MFKKFAILLLCLFYTISVYGIAYNINYCGGEIQSANLGKQATICPMCHGLAKMKCCKTSHVQVKVKDAHLANTSFTLAKLYCANVARLNYNIAMPVWQQARVERILYHGQNAPPPDKDLILIKNCTFRI